MAKRRCKNGRKADGKCRKTKRAGLSGSSRTCTRYGHTGKVMRCVSFVDASGCPPFRGQKKGFSECTTRSRSNTGRLWSGAASRR